MKKIIIFLYFIAASSFGQNTNTDNPPTRKGTFFNITKLGYSSLHDIKREIFVPGQGGTLYILDTNKAHAWSLQTITGYFLSPYFSIGIGVGLDGYHTPTFNTLPVVLDLRLYKSPTEDSLFSYLNIGPTIDIGDALVLKKGMAFNTGLGYAFKVSHRLSLVSDIFYTHKTISLTDEWIRTSDDTIKTNGLGFSLGVFF